MFCSKYFLCLIQIFLPGTSAEHLAADSPDAGRREGQVQLDPPAATDEATTADGPAPVGPARHDPQHVDPDQQERGSQG